MFVDDGKISKKEWSKLRSQDLHGMTINDKNEFDDAAKKMMKTYKMRNPQVRLATPSFSSKIQAFNSECMIAKNDAWMFCS